jgi:N utilization substance protein A
VVVSDDTHTATVIVPDDQLSLAIGKEGQNARLAAKLTGWRIDIKSLGQAVSTGLAEAVTGGDLDGDEGDGRCIAVTSTGIRCRNQARPGSRYCGVHEKEAADES